MLKRDLFFEPSDVLKIHMESKLALTKAIRKVKSNGITTVGMYPSIKSGKMIQYESLLENDFIRFAEFDDAVHSYQDQPFKIEYHDSSSKLRTYTPDFLVTFKNKIKKYRHLKPTVFEVKSTSELKKNGTVIMKKILAAKKYAKKNNMLFRLVTEEDIYTTYFRNISFLLQYKGMRIPTGLSIQVKDAFRVLRKASPSEALAIATSDEERQMHLITALWHLIATHQLHCDLHTSELTMETLISCKPNKGTFSGKSPLYEV